MASRGGRTNAGYGCTPLLRLVARRPVVTAYVTANDRFFRTGPRLFVTQFKISTLLSSAAVGPASGKQQTRQQTRRLSRGGATRARVGEAASCSPQLAGACHVPPPRATAPRIRFVWHTRSLSLSGYVPTCRAPALHTSTAMSQKYLPRNGVRRGV